MKTLLITLLTIISFSIFAQELKLDLVAQIGGTGDDQAYVVKTDDLGNIYIAGSFEDTVDFDPSLNIDNRISVGSEDIFIQKLDPNGNLIWTLTYGGSNYDRVRDLKVEPNGDLLITGLFSDTIDFNPSINVNNLIAVQLQDVFILKLKSNGDFVWAKSIGGNSFDFGTSLDSDFNGNVIVTGFFNGTVDFDPDTSIFNLVSNGDDFFVLKLDSSGKFIWANSVGGSVFDGGRSLKTDSYGNIYTTGYYFSDNVDFDPGLGTAFLPFIQNSRINAFIQKLDSNGNFIWVRGAIGTSNELGSSLTIDHELNVYTTGYFEGTVDFDTDTGTFNLSSNGSRDIFIQKLDSNGNFLWAKSIGSTGDDEGFDIAIDDSNNVYTSGYFEGTADFNTDSTGMYNLTSNGAADIFLQKLDKDGNFIYAEFFGGTGFDQTKSIFLDEKGSVFTTGSFEATVDFDPDTINSFNLSSTGGQDVFILKLNQCLHSSDSIIINSCSSYTSPSGKIWAQTGVYLDTIQNVKGCDSLITINLTITNIDTTLAQINNLNLFANDTLASYQWLDCNNGNSPIVGDTNRSFVAKANGSYAVALEKNGCQDTSACIQVLTVGVNENFEAINSITLYPNPNNGSFTISVGPNYLSKTYQILDISGRLVQEAQFTQQSSQIDLSTFGKGVYFMRVIETGWNQKIVVVD